MKRLWSRMSSTELNPERRMNAKVMIIRVVIFGITFSNLNTPSLFTSQKILTKHSVFGQAVFKIQLSFNHAGFSKLRSGSVNHL
jgi:hypothetical protein